MFNDLIMQLWYVGRDIVFQGEWFFSGEGIYKRA